MVPVAEGIEVAIIGVGNLHRGDDGVGARVVDVVSQHHLPQTKVIALDGEGTALLQEWRGATHVIVVDAATSGRPTGTVTRYAMTDGEFTVRERLQSTHGLGVAEAIILAQTLGELPAHLTLYAVEAERFELGSGLSPEVEAAICPVAEQICHEVFQIVAGQSDNHKDGDKGVQIGFGEPL